MKRLLLILVGWLTLSLPSQSQSVYKMQYWFDGQYSTCVTDSNASGLWQIQLDVSHLSEGLHSINFHFRDTSDHWSSPRTYLFYKSDTANLTYICWFDEDFASRQDGSVGTGNVLLNVDSLSDGTHIVNVLLGEGANTLLKSWLFLKIPTTEQIEDSAYLMLVYMVDEEAMPAVPVDAHTGLAHLNIEVGLLPSGIHTLDYFVLSSDGSMSTPTRAFFYSGNNGIRKYEWWLNDGDTAKRVIDVPPQDTFQLVTMLLVDTLPLRPSCLHFVPTETPPLIYAKNDIHFRFWDNRGVFVQIDSQYVDYNIVDTVYADTIERNSNRTIATPTGSEIHWFKLGVSVGDSMAFMTNRACGMQLYSPNGEEVYSASGVKSVSFGGCHAFMEGDYYLAVHTANTAGGDSLTVHYKHIDKYALLAFSPNEFGNWYGSRITIELLGNGFNLLDSVLLVNSEDTLVVDELLRKKRTEAVASFFIKDSVSNGFYNMILYYHDSQGEYTILSPNAIILEEPDFGEIIVSINGPVGEVYPVPISITVENSGNMDYSYVPFNIAFSNPYNINSMTAENFDINCGNAFDSDSNDVIIWTDSLFGDHQQGALIYTYIPRLGARSKHTYRLKLDVSRWSVFDVYAWSGSPMEHHFNKLNVQRHLREYPGYNEGNGGGNNGESGGGNSSDGNSGGDNGEGNSGGDGGENGNENISNGYPYPNDCDSLSLFPIIRDCLDSMLRNWLSGQIEDFVVEHGNFPGWFRNLRSMAGRATQIMNAALCYAEIEAKWRNSRTFWLRDYTKRLYNVTDDVGASVDGAYNENVTTLETDYVFCNDCLGSILQAYHRRRHNGRCPDPGRPFHVNFMYRPSDPNDIIGYTAESGSRYIGKDVETVGYEIEFENDTARATAPAHIVVVRDTLDASRFDFSSFEWSGISIGEHAQMIEGGKKVYRTIDLRPAINVLAEAVMDFDTLTGIATCTISSLEPMTLEPVIDFSRGILPVNYFGQGEGSVSFKINLANNLVDGTPINNKASIIFDNEEPIMTPTWTNNMDLEDPISYISRIDTIGDSLVFHLQGTDNRSGIWYYTLYGRQDIMQDWTIVSSRIKDSVYRIEANGGLAYYMVTATDSAGNMPTVAPILIHTSPLYVNAGAWHAIASPVHNTDNGTETVDGVYGLVCDKYDLFYYDEADATWRNYKIHKFNLEPGRGYIYRRASADTLLFTGLPNITDIEVPLSSAYDDLSLRGFNLIGNPYPHAINYNKPYYELRPDGTWQTRLNGTIATGQAFFINTTESSYTFADTFPNNSKGSLATPVNTLVFCVSGNGYEDIAYAILGVGDSLKKMNHLNINAPSISIVSHGSTSTVASKYAIASMDRDTKAFELSFITSVNGDYTLTLKKNDDCPLSYIHLIDRMLGKDIDLLRKNTYTFSHSTNNAITNRFLIKLSPNDQNSDSSHSACFAHLNGDIIFVDGMGVLYVYDAIGRLFFTTTISSPGTSIPSPTQPGVYVLRLNGQSQKIVIE